MMVVNFCSQILILLLLLLGGKDNLVKLWDAKSGRELCSLSVMFSFVFQFCSATLLIAYACSFLMICSGFQSWT